MNLWILIILLGALAMALGPVMMLQLSERDRRQEALRRRARELGLRVSLEALPRQTTDTEAPERIPVYRLSAARGEGSSSAWQLVRAAYRHESHLLGDWRWQSRARPGPAELACLKQILPDMPGSVPALGGDPGGWYLFWREAGDVPNLEYLAGQLRALRECHRSPVGD